MSLPLTKFPVILCTWGIFVNEVCDFSCQSISNSIFLFKFTNANHHWTLSGCTHVSAGTSFVHPNLSFKRNLKTTLSNVAFEPGSKSCESSLVKRKAWRSKFLPICCYRQSSAHFEIKGNVAMGDRVESSHAWMQPGGTKLLTDPLHHLVSAAHWRTGCEERLI